MKSKGKYQKLLESCEFLKQCARCKIKKSKKEFYQRLFYRNPYCRECHKKISKEAIYLSRERKNKNG